MSAFVPERLDFQRPGDSMHVMLFNLPRQVDEEWLELFLRHSPTSRRARWGPLHSFALLTPLPSEEEVDGGEERKADSKRTKGSSLAHLYFYTRNGALNFIRAVDGGEIFSQRVRASLFRTRSDKASGFERPVLALHQCADLMNHLFGFDGWSLGIVEVRVFQPELDKNILAGQTIGCALEDELEGAKLAPDLNWKCSFTCKARLHVPERTGRRELDFNARASAVSHGKALSPHDMSNAKKRSVTNAYRALFARILLLRTSADITRLIEIRLPAYAHAGMDGEAAITTDGAQDAMEEEEYVSASDELDGSMLEHKIAQMDEELLEYEEHY